MRPEALAALNIGRGLPLLPLSFLAMPRITSVSWTPEQLEIIRTMYAKGASVDRVAVALKRSKHSVRTKANEIGVRFPTARELRRKRLTQEAGARSGLE